MQPQAARNGNPGRGAEPLPFWSSVAADILAHIPLESREMTTAARVLTNCKILMLSSGLHLTLLYRTGHSLRRRLGPAGRLTAAVTYWLARHVYGCTISPAARLEGGLIFPHPQNIVIGPEVTAGPRAWIYQNVTLGGGGRRLGMPVIGSEARILTGAVVSGPVRIGDDVMIGANAVVSRDVPDGALVTAAMPVVKLSRNIEQRVAQ